MKLGIYPREKGNPQQVFKQQPDINIFAFLRDEYVQGGEIGSRRAAVTKA